MINCHHYGLKPTISIQLPDGTNLCELELDDEVIDLCETAPIPMTLTEGEPVQTDVISQFTNIGTPEIVTGGHTDVREELYLVAESL